MLAIGPVFHVPTVVLGAGVANFEKLNYPIFRVQMIASARTIRTREERFLEMLPQIRAQARYAFRKELLARRQSGHAWALDRRVVQFR